MAKVTDAPDILFRDLHIQKQRLEEFRAEYDDYVAPKYLNGMRFCLNNKEIVHGAGNQLKKKDIENGIHYGI